MSIDKNGDSRFPDDLNLIYIIGTYPGLTTTFIDREIRSLRKRGVNLLVVSIRKPWGPISAEQMDLQRDVKYLLPISLLTLIWGHLRSVLLQPVVYFGTLGYLITRPHPTLKSRFMTILHFGEGVYAAHLVRHRSWDQIHAHFVDRAATVALTVGRMLDLPYSLTAHAGDIYVDPVLLPEKLSEAKFVVTCTGYNKTYLTQFGEGLFNHKLKRIYHGLELSSYQRKISPPRDKRIILSVGQLKERKGYSYLLQACRTLVDQGFDFECHIVGEGHLRKSLESHITQLSLEDIVKLCGSLPHQEVIEKYQQASIFVLPAILGANGDRDGVPNVILEAMAMELPVVSTQHSGIPEAVQDCISGLLVPPADEIALAQALEKLLNDSDLRNNFGRSGRKTVMAQFNVEQNVKQLLEEFRT